MRRSSLNLTSATQGYTVFLWFRIGGIVRSLRLSASV